ncbi:MAG: nucleotidyltransferase domain-containing protein [Armatimonadetes bacterium]|nr:nucleotidyltransferase domain-containing protein [Armatimonadota bacterium]
MLEIKDILSYFRTQIESLYGPRLKSVVLFGSWARNEATENSDVDLAVVLDGNVAPGQEIDAMIDIITETNLKYDTLLSVYPVSENDYRNLNSPILRNIRAEGVAA